MNPDFASAEQHSITKAIVPAAGLGTRMYPITRSQPKEMLPLGRKPTIQWAAEELMCAGIRSVLFVTGPNKRAVEDHFDPAVGSPQASGDSQGQLPATDPADVFSDRSRRLLYIRQGGPRGLADAILCGDTFADGDHVVVALGDVVIRGPKPGSLTGRICEYHVERHAAATIAVNPVPDELVSRYGIVSPAGCHAPQACFDVADLVEKPARGEAPSNLAITGRYVLSPIAFDYLRSLTPGHGGELQLTDALQAMLRAGLPICAVPLAADEEALDIGDIPGYWKAFLKVALEDEVLGEDMRRFAAQIMEGF